ncbi:MAG: dTDP-glucose 4,6-dehydratase [Rhodospirillaceae bacterium]|nr:dTDP-glucose 4,6-dehydratase [Rhodospirillaceae bacterium]
MRESADDRAEVQRHDGPSIGTLIERRLSRRSLLKGAVAATAIATLPLPRALRAAEEGAVPDPGFTEITHGLDDDSHVAPGYRQQVLIRWGDPVLSDAPAFDPSAQTAASQSAQFGYNNDFIAFMPLPRGSASADHGLLCVNHEYTNGHLMFPGYGEDDFAGAASSEELKVEMAAHGMSVVEIRRDPAAGWAVVRGPLNRRITALDTAMRIAGPAAGHPRLQTTADPDGMTVIGMINNCAGGVTPWGTVLTCEENTNFYFAGDVSAESERANHARMGVGGGSAYGWHRIDTRFDVAREPHEPNRFGWVVEIDPYDPESTPVKRTALGRFKHEGATTVVNSDGRVVVYSGDDGRFEYVYKFVTNGVFDPNEREANRDLLDDGTLYAARFAADGLVHWLALVWGQGPLTPGNGFGSQADVLIEARRAADLLGATPMDRPEDIETNPVTGSVYVVLTNNTKRKSDQIDAANPRAENRWGHVLEIIPTMRDDGADHAGAEARWDVFLLAGDPRNSGIGALYHPDVSENGWLSCPDNCTFDTKGNLWLATDGAPKTAGFADGLYACATVGEGRALTRLFFRSPVGAEVCGPCFTPDDTALFVAVQHPGDTEGSTFAAPATGWPDFTEGMPPRPSVVAITRNGGGAVGG